MTTKKIFFMAAAAMIVGGSIFFFAGRFHSRIGSDILLNFVPSPAVVLKDYAGADVALSKFHGTPLVVFFLASWCSPCMKQAGELLSFEKEFGGRVLFIAVNRGESFDALRRISGAAEGDTRGRMYLSDPSDALYRVIGGFSMPETLFIDADGMIRFHKRGTMDSEEIRRRIQDIFGL